MQEISPDLANISHIGYSSVTGHGPYPPTVLGSRKVVYFGTVSRDLWIPSASLFATLSYFVRLEKNGPMMPTHLPKARLEANLAGRIGPTCEDVEHFARHCRTRFTRVHYQDISSHPRANEQLTSYRLGDFTGSWEGSCIVSKSSMINNEIDLSFLIEFRYPRV